MPKSRREKTVHLTQTDKKGRTRKSALLAAIQHAVDEHERVYLLGWENMRAGSLATVRLNWPTSKMLCGKARIMQVALGKEGDEYMQGLAELSDMIHGECALFFTNEKEKDIVKFFSTFQEEDFARFGQTATANVVIPEGPMPQFQHSMEPMLRTRLGLNTELRNGVIYNLSEKVVAQEGEKLTAESAQLLRLHGLKMSVGKFVMRAKWDKESGKVTTFKH